MRTSVLLYHQASTKDDHNQFNRRETSVLAVALPTTNQHARRYGADMGMGTRRWWPANIKKRECLFWFDCLLACWRLGGVEAWLIAAWGLGGLGACVLEAWRRRSVIGCQKWVLRVRYAIPEVLGFQAPSVVCAHDACAANSPGCGRVFG
jgi:hypothetical protein